jgi:hypothetical protein
MKTHKPIITRFGKTHTEKKGCAVSSSYSSQYGHRMHVLDIDLYNERGLEDRCKSFIDEVEKALTV